MRSWKFGIGLVMILFGIAFSGWFAPPDRSKFSVANSIGTTRGQLGFLASAGEYKWLSTGLLITGFGLIVVACVTDRR